MKRQQSVRICAVLLALGGLMWCVKAGVIMTTGSQPPLTFELGQLLFPFASLALYLSIGKPVGLQKAGLALAVLAFAGSLFALLYPLFPGTDIPTAEEFHFPNSLFSLVAGFGGFVALVLIAAGFWKARSDLGRRRRIPIIVGIIPLPLVLTSVIHFEMPIFLIGLSWVALAYYIRSLPVLLQTSEIATPISA